MLYIIIGLIGVNIALFYTVYQQDQIIDNLIDRLFDVTLSIEPIDTDWEKWEGER